MKKRQVLQQMVLKQLDITSKIKKIWTQTLHHSKNYIKFDYTSKCEIIKHLQDNMGENLDDLEVGDDFLD